MAHILSYWRSKVFVLKKLTAGVDQACSWVVKLKGPLDEWYVFIGINVIWRQAFKEKPWNIELHGASLDIIDRAMNKKHIGPN